MGHLQRVQLAKRGRLLLQTPGHVPFGLAFVLMLILLFPELVMSTGLLSFKHPLVIPFSSGYSLTIEFSEKGLVLQSTTETWLHNTCIIVYYVLSV